MSELRKPERTASPAVRAWVSRSSTTDFALSVITVMEIEIGVRRIERRDARQGSMLRTWFEPAVLTAFRDLLLPVDTDVARIAAAMHVPDPRPERDALLAATARGHGLVVVSRNTADVVDLGVELVDPWNA